MGILQSIYPSISLTAYPVEGHGGTEADFS